MTREQIEAALKATQARLAALNIVEGTTSTDGRAYVRGADLTKRPATWAEQQQIDADRAECVTLEASLAQHDEILRLAPISGVRGDNPQYDVHRGTGERVEPWHDEVLASSPNKLRDRALAALDSVGEHLDERARSQVEVQLRAPAADTAGAQLVIAGSDPAYRSAFAKLMRDPARGHMEFDDAERAAFARAQSVARAINIGTNASGGFLMPLTLDPAIMLTSGGVIDPIRQISRQVTTVTDHWKGITSAGVTASYGAEGSEVADASPSDLAQPEIAVHRGSCYVEVTYEAAMDLDFTDQLGMLFADAKATVEASKFWAGSGADEPAGVVTGLDGTASEVAPTTAETFAVADLYKLQEAVPPRFRARASWVGNLAIYNDIRQFGIADSHALWTRLADGLPGGLLGHPAYEASESDSGFDPASTADNFVLTFGDFRAGFIVADRLGSMVTVHELYGANGRPTGSRGHTLWFRNGSKVVNTAALRILSIPTAAA